MILKLRFCLSFWQEILHYEDGEALAQAAQRGFRCSTPGDTQGQVGWGHGQPDPVGGGGNQPTTGGWN